jgi:hypothetical protein
VSVLDADRIDGLVGLASGAGQSPLVDAGVDLVGDYGVNARLGPLPTTDRADALLVEDLGDPVHADAVQHELEHALDEGCPRGIELELHAGRGLGPAADLAVADGRGTTVAETHGRVLAHAALDVLGEVGAVELVDDLEDALQHASGRGVLDGLVERDDLHPVALELSLVEHRVLAVAGEAAELPDQDEVEGARLAAGGLEHLAEGGPVVGAGALGSVLVLAHDFPAASAGSGAAGVALGGDGQILLGLPLGGTAQVDGAARDGGRGLTAGWSGHGLFEASMREVGSGWFASLLANSSHWRLTRSGM